MSQPRICLKEKKYKLEESLNNLTHHEYRFARNVLPKIIGKCNNTLNNYINILSDSNEEIPYSVGLKLEQFFGIEHGGMSNSKEEEVQFKVLYNEWRNKRTENTSALK
ncbi:MAG: hypothetical protein EOO43_15670 [Flavobacterium sp.]|nr:MAG: hypothetical protein EOO43_15670 [Flavobacterium sp.]